MAEHESLHVQQKQMSRDLFTLCYPKKHTCQSDEMILLSWFPGFQGFPHDINLHAGLETRNLDLLVLFGYSFIVLFVKYKRDPALWHGAFKLSLS